MNHPRKNSIRAQASSEMNTEAAVKLLPLTSSKDENDLEFKDGDGGPDPGFVNCITIDVAENGYCVTTVYVDMPPERYVVTDFADVLKILKGEYRP